VIIIAQSPLLMPFKNQIKKRICLLLNLEQNVLNIKAKTNEGLDAVGHSEAISCFANASLVREG
jgi:2-C-methyl-D-erythritol 2,4-cyclodiphosphate synthase